MFIDLARRGLLIAYILIGVFIYLGVIFTIFHYHSIPHREALFEYFL